MVIELKRLDESLKEDLLKICNGVDRTFLSGRMPDPYTEKDADDWIALWKERDGKNGIFRIITVDGVAAGDISVEQKIGASSKDAELGYLLLDEFKGKGIMTEVVYRICQDAFDTLGLTRITAYAFAPNIGSIRVLEKNGFELEGIMRDAVHSGDDFFDLNVYGRLK